MFPRSGAGFLQPARIGPAYRSGRSSLATLVQMVGAGIGVTVIPQMAVRVETRSAAVDWVPFAGPQPKRTVGMIWRKASPLTRHQAAFAQLVRQAAGDAADIRPEDRPQV